MALPPVASAADVPDPARGVIGIPVLRSAFGGLWSAAAEPAPAAPARFELLDDSASPLGALAQSVPALLFTCTPDGQVNYVNRLWCEYTGEADVQALAAHWRELVHPDDQPRLLAEWQRCEEAGADSFNAEFRLRHASGAFRWQLARARLLRDAQGRPRMWSGVLTEVEQHKALAAAKDEFLSVVSHELRSPLNAIRGWAHVLRKTAELPEQHLRALDAIDRNVAAQARMVDDLLDTQRLLSGRVRLERRSTPLPALLEQAVEPFRAPAADKRITLTLRHAGDVPLIEADPERLRQALVNLVSNAMKFTPAGGQVEVRSVRRAPDRVAIEVADTGVGLEAAQTAQIFEPFRQASDSSSTRRQGGLGLGLALARQLVELHGGRLSVSSEGLNHGATFSIELPAPPITETAPLAQTAAPPPALAGRSVVVLEDDPESRQILELLLHDEGVKALFFSTADEGFSHLSQADGRDRPDALISDIAMPGEDGYSLIRRVRELHRRRGEPALPAVALTAFASTSDRAHALAAGFDAHLGKPLDPELLRSTLQELLRARSNDTSPSA